LAVVLGVAGEGLPLDKDGREIQLRDLHTSSVDKFRLPSVIGVDDQIFDTQTQTLIFFYYAVVFSLQFDGLLTILLRAFK